jgi:hypothetical protein
MKRTPFITDKEFRVTVKMAREYSATIKVWATDQAEADQMALDLFEEHVYDINGARGVSLGLPPPWDEHESHDRGDRHDLSLRRLRQGDDWLRRVLQGER